jgi:hypothetical protein
MDKKLQATAYIGKKEYDKAIVEYNKALAVEPEHIEASALGMRIGAKKTTTELSPRLTKYLPLNQRIKRRSITSGVHIVTKKTTTSYRCV